MTARALSVSEEHAGVLQREAGEEARSEVGLGAAVVITALLDYQRSVQKTKQLDHDMYERRQRNEIDQLVRLASELDEAALHHSAELRRVEGELAASGRALQRANDEIVRLEKKARVKGHVIVVEPRDFPGAAGGDTF